MKNYKSITYKEEYIQAESNGEKNLEFAKELWSQIVNACEKHECYKVLGIANTTAPVTTIETVYHVDIFEQLNITSKYRIAWVEMNPQHRNAIGLIENLLSSHGVDCKVFSEVLEAKKWLFYGKLPNEQG